MPESAFTEGSLIAGRYRLDQPLGEGGMGEVWAATHTVTRRSVALKFLKESVRNKPGLRQRFLREASTASALHHPHVVEILDVFDFEERAPVLVMELLHGETLGKKLSRDGRLSMEETAALLLPVTSAVGSAHALGIVHRDIKPENIFLARNGDESLVKVLDFGIAKLTAEHYLEGGRSALITDTGSMLGTPCYMAPEQATGESVADHRADIWSIGVILYECLSGTRPIEGENLAQVVSRLVSAGIIPLERLAPELPHEVTALVSQMLSRQPGRRPESLAEIGKVLGRYTSLRTPSFGPPSTGPRLESSSGEQPRARVFASRDADPRGATMLSSPPVGGSIVTEGNAKPARSRRMAIGVLAVVVVAFVASMLALRGASGPPEPGASVAAAAPPSPLGPAAATAAALPKELEQVPAPALAPAPVTASASAPSSKASAPRKISTPQAGPKRAPARVGPAAVKTVTDEDTLFPGRK